MGRRPLERAKGLIEFRGVGARYEGRGEPVLHAIGFIARPGTVTAIVGRSGSGKSSLVKLIPRFYEPSDGSILLDGHPLDDYPLADLRCGRSRWSRQQVMLFDGSVAGNVARVNCRMPIEKIEAAVRLPCTRVRRTHAGWPWIPRSVPVAGKLSGLASASCLRSPASMLSGDARSRSSTKAHAALDNASGAAGAGCAGQTHPGPAPRL